MVMMMMMMKKVMVMMKMMGMMKMMMKKHHYASGCLTSTCRPGIREFIPVTLQLLTRLPAGLTPVKSDIHTSVTGVHSKAEVLSAEDSVLNAQMAVVWSGRNLDYGQQRRSLVPTSKAPYSPKHLLPERGTWSLTALVSCDQMGQKQ
ncbi:unnamed protein product, partial [Pleuronectes platessa]